MNDDRHDDTNEPLDVSGNDEKTPAGPPPPSATPVQPGGSTVPPAPPAPGSTPTKPADYYAQPPGAPEKKSGCGKWAIGCGAAGCLVGILLIAFIVWFAKAGWPMMMSAMVGEVETHVEQFGDEIDPAVREDLETELKELRRHIEDGDIRLQDMQGVVYSMQDVVGDEQVTNREAEELLEELRELNEIGASGEF